MSLSRFPQVLLATGKAGCAAQCVKGPVLTLVPPWFGQPLPLIPRGCLPSPRWAPAYPGFAAAGPRSMPLGSQAPLAAPAQGMFPYSESVSLGFSPTPPGWKRAGRGRGTGRQEGEGEESRQGEGPADPTVSHRPSWDPGVGG